mgnify:CR=1 FL=1
MISESMRNHLKATGLGALMRGAGLVTRFIPIPQPTLLVGPGSSARLGQAVAGFGHAKILIVTDAVIAKLGLLKDLTDALAAGGAAWATFDEITPDAPIPLIERGKLNAIVHESDVLSKMQKREFDLSAPAKSIASPIGGLIYPKARIEELFHIFAADNVAVVQDPAGNIKPSKAKSTQKIDGIVAGIMAQSRATVHGVAQKSSVYEGRGIRVL